MSHRAKIRRDDLVKVIAGKDKGKTGKVLRVDLRKEKVYVEGLNIQKRAQRPVMLRDTQRTQSTEGGVIEREAALQISNVAVVCPACGQPTRIGYRMTEDHKVRVCRKCGKDVDR